MRHYTISRFSAVALILAAVTITLLNFLTARRSLETWRKLTSPQDDHYSYIGDDYPIELPIFVRPASLVVRPAQRYSVDSDEDWASLMPAGLGFGFVRLGDQGRLFDPSFYHQLHCLDGLRSAIRDDRKRFSWHVHHCLNFIRQAILCNSDITLEPSYTYQLSENVTVPAASGIGVAHKCRDWTQVRQFVEENNRKYADVPFSDFA